MADSTREVDNNDLTDFNVAQETVTAREYQIIKVDIGAVGSTQRLSGLTNNNAAPAATNFGVLPAIANASAPTFTEGNQVLLSTDTAGALRVTGGGGGTEYVVDDAAPTNPTGTSTLLERDDALSTVTEIAGDWTNMRGTAEGALWVQDFNSDAILADTTAILADTASMDTNLGTIAGAVSGTEMQVDVITSALPTGASTAALQTSSEAILTTIDADTGTIAGAVSGTEMQVDIVAALPAGTNAIGTLAANSGVDIGDVDVTSIIPGTGATNLGKAIGSAVGATDTGIAALAVRDDALATLSDAAGDFVPLKVNSQGATYITHNGVTLASSNDTAITTATTTTLIAAPGASNHLRIYYIQASNTHATVASQVSWRDGAAGVQEYRTNLAPLYGVFAHNIKPGYWDLTTNTALSLTTSGAGNVYWTVEYESLAD